MAVDFILLEEEIDSVKFQGLVGEMGLMVELGKN
jgi:hypothetical protein